MPNGARDISRMKRRNTSQRTLSGFEKYTNSASPDSTIITRLIAMLAAATNPDAHTQPRTNEAH